ncbi:RagB/SusD family nutrient uptake outer membrane protein [Pedobacter sp. AW1-32]|uniref:RagB/SusD family nutrient uptake outer membrane protein n=1 Tax=Pedobacter sp. AW1-32 TaxID=3383026 RepID=UPI003FF026B6
MKKIIYSLLVIIAFSSCEKILDKDPTDQLSIEDLFKDVAGSKTALAGAYSNLLSTDHYQTKTMIFPELLAGNLKYSKESAIILSDVYNAIQNPTESSMSDTYTKLYSELNNVNNVIKYTPQASGSETDRIKIVAEAKSIRALIHFDLIRIFARPYNYQSGNALPGIALVLQPQLYSDAAPQRATIEECYQTIITDLTDAINAFDDTEAPALTSTYKQHFFTKSSAQALLAKVYLYANKWDQAFLLSDALIKSGKYTLLSNANYVASWTGKIPSSESILELAIETTFSGNSLGTYYDVSNTSYRQFAATNDILSLYNTSDVRSRASLFNLLTISGTNYYFTKKYATGGTSATPVKILRLSELYLIRAEAAVEKTLTDFTQANADLNTIRKRADASATTLNLTNKTDLINSILLERRKELAFEGNLLFDLTRRKKDVERVDVTSSVKNFTATDYRLVMPIPIATMNVNNKMIQNEGY